MVMSFKRFLDTQLFATLHNSPLLILHTVTYPYISKIYNLPVPVWRDRIECLASCVRVLPQDTLVYAGYLCKK